MPKQRGQMIPRGDNKWLLRVYLGSKMVNGRRHREYANETFEGTTSQARQRLTKMNSDLDTQSFVKPSKRTVHEYLVSWLSTLANVETKTKLDYVHRIAKDVDPFIGGLQLSQLSPEHIRSLYGKLATDARQLSPRTIRYTHTILSHALSDAVEDGLLVRNPCERKSVRKALPKKVDTPPAILTPEQVLDVIEREPDRQLKALWRVLLTTGLRPQEGLVLRWSDMADGMLSVNRTIAEMAKGHETVKEYGKTDGAIRTLAVDEETLELLRQHRAEQLKEIMQAGENHQRQDYIFSTRTGEFLSRSNVRRYWKRALARCEIAYTKLYSTRHTHASHYIAATGDVKGAAERLGHSDPAMTLRVYTHSLPGADKENLKATVGLLKRKPA